MSNPIQSVPTPTGEFQAHFGGPPGISDAAAECKKWEKLCGELLVERQKLREDLTKTQAERDAYLKEVYYYLRKDYEPPTFTREEVFAALESEQSFGDLVAELTKKYGQEK